MYKVLVHGCSSETTYTCSKYVELAQMQLIVMEYLCHKSTRVCSTCRKHFPVICSFMTCHCIVPRLTQRVPLVAQELPTLPEHLSSSPVFSGVRVTRSLVLCVMFCRSLFVLSSFYFWPLCCLSFDLRILITP